MLRKIFDLDNGFMRGLSRSTDLIVLNVLFLVCSLLVVTFGASLSALYSMTLKMVRNEEDYTVRGFFKAFRENLRSCSAGDFGNGHSEYKADWRYQYGNSSWY